MDSVRILFSALVLGLGIVIGIQYYRPQERLTDRMVFQFNERYPSYSADTLRLMGFGYGRMMSSLLWLRFLQHTPPEKIEPGQVSWIYRDLETVTEVDPDFYPAFEMGGIFLSVITEDKKGAELILLKGTRNFPKRWRIRAYLAYHYHLELGRPDLALTHYKIGAGLEGAPPLLAERASSLMTSSLGKQEGIFFLKNLLQVTKDPYFRSRIEEKLKRLEGG